MGSPWWAVEVMQPDHWAAVRAIYQASIATGDATFETSAPDWQAWDGAHRKTCGCRQVIGWAATATLPSAPSVRAALFPNP